MSFEAKLLEATKKATGDETITDVAEFQPKGTAGAQAAGAMIGSLAGGAATDGNSWGRGVGAASGAAVGGAMATGLSEGLPQHIAVAVSPDEVYVLGMRSFGVKHLRPLAKIDRDKLGIEVHQRASVRTVVLEDLDSGHKIPLEAPRLNL
jgi:hypothetical protein